MKLANKFIWITGASSGVGEGMARVFHREGAELILSARRTAELERVRSTCTGGPRPVHLVPFDVTDQAQRDQAAAQVLERFPRLDVLVNNAGIAPDLGAGTGDTSVFRADLDGVRQAMETNAIAPLRLCQVLIPLMKGRGRVVNVSSGMGQLDDMNGCCPAYRLSKVSLNAVTRIFADELQGTEVKINSVCPGWVRTEMGGASAPLSVEEGAEGIVWAATLPDDGPSGGFFRHGERIPW
jgi:NAD(P)-dependent dehydrogenase (short-subunit alcohol dehydrogenase family)